MLAILFRVVVVVGWCLLAGSSVALAHASLISSEPSDGAMLAHAPARVVLRFNEPVSPLALSLIGADGVRNAVEGQSTGSDVTVDRLPSLANGNYVLSWRVVSDDGHPIAGSILFSVGPTSEAAGMPPADSVDGRVHTAIYLVRVILYAALLLGVGGLFFAAFIGPQPDVARKAQIGLLAAAMVALPLSVALQALDALGLGLNDALSPAVWQSRPATSWDVAALIAGIAAVSALIGLCLNDVPKRIAALIALASLGIAFASTGHASAAQPQWMTRPLVFIHAVMIAVWVGALLPMAALARQPGGDVRTAVARFSRFIPAPLLALVVAGVGLAVVQVGRLSALWSTEYGRVLLAKLALMTLLLSLAAANRWLFTARVVSGDVATTARFRRSMVAELVIVLVIFAVVALWRFTPPPRSLDASSGQPAVVHLHSGQAMAGLSINPAQVGPVSVVVEVTKPDFTPLSAKQVTVTLAMPESGVEPIRREAVFSEGTWAAEGFVLPVAGSWDVRVSVLITDFDSVQLQGEVMIARPQ